MSNKTVIISCLCMVTAFLFIHKIASGPNVIVSEKNLDNFPYKIGQFVGSDITMEESVIKELNTDVYVFRNYTNDKGEVINLYIGYYGTAKGGRTGHTPKGCYPGSGWAIIDESKPEVAVDLNGETKILTLNSMKVNKGNITELVYHWYQSNRDEVLSSGIEQNLHRFKSRILHNRNDGAFIRVSSAISNDLSYTKKYLEIFIRDIFPIIIRYWPVEK